MGIEVEFNQDLALRGISEYTTGKRKIEECVPDPLEEGKVHEFLKRGLRLFHLSDSELRGQAQISLMKTTGEEHLSRPIARVKILETTHFLISGECYTKGKYQVSRVFDPKDPTIHFEACKILDELSTLSPS
jgi:hypothetical protein